jgi:hypothetical protein
VSVRRFLLLALLIVGGPIAAPGVAPGEDDGVGTNSEAIVVGTPTPDPVDTPTPTPTPTASPSPVPPGEATATPQPAQTPSANNAARQPEEIKREEAKTRCRRNVSRLLATGGSASLDRDDSWAWLPFLIAAVCAAFVAAGYAVRRYRALRETRDSSPPSLLEVVATLVAICAGVAGLAAQFVPGFGPHEVPPRKAEMTVRSISARITHGEFVRRAGGEQPRSDVDQREIGNVVWLQMHLSGYRGDKLILQWGSYEAEGGGSLVAATTYQLPITVSGESDEQTLFEPVWIGYPNLERFRVQFRLLTGNGEVQELASTGPMRGSVARYLCEQ